MAPTELAIGDKVIVSIGEYRGQTGEIVEIQQMNVGMKQPESFKLNMGGGRMYWIASAHVTLEVHHD